ncbi:hypothetical protein JYB64_23390, partial [Algoriphagus aestuarii]|nr:hypothetical protein [Algoriphagus aestuarii]
CAKWDILASVIGEVTDVTPEEEARGGRLVMTWRGETIVDLPPRTAADQGPVYHRPIERPADQDALLADDPAALPRPSSDEELRDQVLRVLAAPRNILNSRNTHPYHPDLKGNPEKRRTS